MPSKCGFNSALQRCQNTIVAACCSVKKKNPPAKRVVLCLPLKGDESALPPEEARRVLSPFMIDLTRHPDRVARSGVPFSPGTAHTRGS